MSKKKKQTEHTSVGLYKDIHTPYVRGYAYDVDPISGMFEPVLLEAGVLIYDEILDYQTEITAYDACFWLNRYLHRLSISHIGNKYDG